MSDQVISQNCDKRAPQARIGWALVNYGPIFSPVYASHLRAIAKASRTLEMAQLGGIHGVGAGDRMYVHSQQNRMIKDFLADESLSHILMVESDMILPDDTIPLLLAVGKPIVSAVYFLRGGFGQPCLYKKTLSQAQQAITGMSPVSLFPTDAPFNLGGCPGVGCVLIERRVFETVEWPYFDLKEDHYGSDIYFFNKVLKAGFEVWCHPGVMCGQIEYTVWDQHDYHTRLKDDPTFAGSGYILGLTQEPDRACR